MPAHIERLNDMVAEFRAASGQPIDVLRAMALINEEGTEFLQAADGLRGNPTIQNMEDFLKETADLLYVLAGMVEQTKDMPTEELGEILRSDPDAVLHNMVVATTAEEIMMQAAEVFLTDEIISEALERVHASNMSKIVDGEIRLREDGKVLKPDTYVAPDLYHLAEEALANWDRTKAELEAVDTHV